MQTTAANDNARNASYTHELGISIQRFILTIISSDLRAMMTRTVNAA